MLATAMSDFDPSKLFLFGRDTVVPSPFTTFTPKEALPLSGVHYLRDDDEVLAVTVGKLTRAYPVRVAAPHHIVEDTLGEAHVTVTF